MDFLIHSRASGATEDDPALDERHWSYMDGFADRFTARGPTLGPDRETWTGSLHVVALEGSQSAHRFVTEEPYQLAGLFEEHLTLRFDNLLGRTMWQFTGAPDEPRFLVLARYADQPPSDRRPQAVADLPPQLRDALIVYGELRHLDEHPTGVAMAVQLPSREALDVLLVDERTGLTDLVVEVHDWEFGGRR